MKLRLFLLGLLTLASASFAYLWLSQQQTQAHRQQRQAQDKLALERWIAQTSGRWQGSAQAFAQLLEQEAAVLPPGAARDMRLRSFLGNLAEIGRFSHAWLLDANGSARQLYPMPTSMPPAPATASTSSAGSAATSSATPNQAMSGTSSAPAGTFSPPARNPGWVWQPAEGHLHLAKLNPLRIDGQPHKLLLYFPADQSLLQTAPHRDANLVLRIDEQPVASLNSKQSGPKLSQILGVASLPDQLETLARWWPWPMGNQDVRVAVSWGETEPSPKLMLESPVAVPISTIPLIGLVGVAFLVFTLAAWPLLGGGLRSRRQLAHMPPESPEAQAQTDQALVPQASAGTETPPVRAETGTPASPVRAETGAPTAPLRAEVMTPSMASGKAPIRLSSEDALDELPSLAAYLLVVGRSGLQRRLLRLMLESLGLEVIEADDVTQGAAICLSRRPDLILIDGRACAGSSAQTWDAWCAATATIGGLLARSVVVLETTEAMVGSPRNPAPRQLLLPMALADLHQLMSGWLNDATPNSPERKG